MFKARLASLRVLHTYLDLPFICRKKAICMCIYAHHEPMASHISPRACAAERMRFVFCGSSIGVASNDAGEMSEVPTSPDLPGIDQLFWSMFRVRLKEHDETPSHFVLHVYFVRILVLKR